jgi:hypothetical protein
MLLQVCGTSADDPDLVQVEGPGVLGWCVWPQAPSPGSSAHVELELPEVAWHDVDLSDAPGPLRLRADGLSVRGRVVDVDEQHTLALELPEDSILLVDTLGEVPPHVVGRTATFGAHRVVAYPTHV